jgi:multiple sugar transport system permease protein
LLSPASRAALPFVAPALLLMGLVILMPALYVLWLSFHSSTFGVSPTFVGWDNYAKILQDPYFWRSLVNTAVIVLVVVHAELLLGLAMATLFAGGLPGRKVLIACVLAPYAVSEVGAIVMWRTLFDPDTGPVMRALAALGLPPLEWSVTPSHGLVMVALLSVWLHLPFTFVILYAARLAIPIDVYEAARIDGASPWQTFRRVTLPLLMPALISAFLVAFTLSFDEFAIASFLAGSQQTWPVYLFAQLRVPSLLPQLIAVSSIVFIASMLLVLSAEIGRRLAERRYGSEYTARGLA